MNQPNAAAAGEFRIGGELPIQRLGFGAMRITGKGIWGEPDDPEECLRVLKRVPELGVNFIDTADTYGPEVSERLIREALHPYEGLLIATKGGHTRPGPEKWVPVGRPEYLIQQMHLSLWRLGVEQITLWQLHRIDSKVPREEQFETIKGFLEQGLIRYAGLSEVSIEEIEAAEEFFPVTTVQNRYNSRDRRSDEVLDYCETHGIGFIPWAPLDAGRYSKPNPALNDVAAAHDASPHQIALAWLLQRSPVMLPIPGTSKVAHLEENVAAANITLTDEEFASLKARRK